MSLSCPLSDPPSIILILFFSRNKQFFPFIVELEVFLLWNLMVFYCGTWEIVSSLRRAPSLSSAPALLWFYSRPSIKHQKFITIIFILLFVLYVHNTKEVQTIIRDLKKIPNIKNVVRIWDRLWFYWKRFNLKKSASISWTCINTYYPQK